MRCVYMQMLLIAMFLAPASAWAGFHVCNDTPQEQHVAFSYNDDGNWLTRGWWGIAPKACATLLSGEGNARFVYLRLRDRPGQHFLHSSIKFCASHTDFSGTGSTRCPSQHLMPLDFARIDAGRNAADVTVKLSSLLQIEGTPAEAQAEAERVTMKAVFEGCRRATASVETICSFVAYDREVISRITDDTPRTAARTVTNMHSGAPVVFTATVVRDFLKTTEVRLEAIDRRPADAAHELLLAAQGTWVSVDDTNDSFTVEGATRLNAYVGIGTTREFLSISKQCHNYRHQGFILHSWSKDDAEGLCYQIETITKDSLILHFLPSGRVLRYERPTNG